MFTISKASSITCGYNVSHLFKEKRVLRIEQDHELVIKSSKTIVINAQKWYLESKAIS